MRRGEVAVARVAARAHALAREVERAVDRRQPLRLEHDPHAAAIRDLVRVPEQPEAGDVGDSVRLERTQDVGGPLFSVRIQRIARSSGCVPAMPRLTPVMISPVPSGFVRKIASPGRAPFFGQMPSG